MRKFGIDRQLAARFVRFLPPLAALSIGSVAGWRITDLWIGDGLVGAAVVVAAVAAWATWDLSR